MSKSDKFEDDLLRHIFVGSALTNLGTSGGTTDLWISLHTADPGDAGSTANEGGYAQYTRVSVDRSGSGFAVTSGVGAGGASVSPAANIDFPQNTSTSTGTFTHFSVDFSSNSVAADQFYNGTISPSINFSQNVTPRLTTASSITED